MAIVECQNVTRVYKSGDHELRALTFGTSLPVGAMVSKKNKKIDMVEALKGAE